jgi:hypothetical protein
VVLDLIPVKMVGLELLLQQTKAVLVVLILVAAAVPQIGLQMQAAQAAQA